MLVTVPVTGQTLDERLYTTNQYLNYSDENANFISLKAALDAIEESHNIAFFYKYDLIEDKMINESILSSENLADQFGVILATLGLTYQKHTDRTYLILEKDKAGSVPGSGDQMLLQRSVSGQVTDAQTGEPLPGVTIIIEGTTTGTTTDMDGQFSLNVPGPDAVLVFSFVGYVSEQITVEDQDQIDVSLESDIGELGELVVVGYGEMERRSLTSSISQVRNVDLDQQPIGQPEVALAGRMAGVNITQARNIPGESPIIRVRGHSSISASNDPLIVIDGFPGGDFSNIDMNDVESIEVLKDASAAAIYGSRGAGGVIIVSTKAGSVGQKPQFSLNTYFGMQFPMLHGEDNWVPGGQEYQETLEKYINREWIWEGGDPDIPMWGDDRRPNNFRVNPVVAEGDYNWESIIFDPSPIQNYNLSVGGASGGVNYYVSGTYRNEEGVLPNNWYRQYSLRANVRTEITDRVHAAIRVNPRYSHQRNRSDSGIHNTIKVPPFVAPEVNPETGMYYKPSDYWSFRVSAMNSPFDRYQGSHFYGDSFKNLAEARLGIDIRDDLNFEINVGTDLTYNTFDNFTEQRTTGANQTTGSAGDWRNHTWLNENLLSYQTTLADGHTVNAVAGASYQKSHSRNTSISALPNSFQNEIIRTINNAEAAPWSNSTKTQWGLASYFGRVNYNFDDRYLLSASIRRDGSSRFGPQNRWGTFPSASVGWVMSQENFMPDIGFLDELKLRASFGVTGNFGIGDFQYLGSISDASYALNNQLVQGQIQSSFGNEELRWETTESFGLGIDLNLLDNRLNVVFDYYNQQTSDLLYNVNIPASSGFTNTMVNVGDVKNRGIELEVNTRNVSTPSVSWQTSFNFTRNRNEVTSLHRDVTEIINTHSRGMGWILRVGEPMFSYYGHEMIGVLKTQEDIDNNPTKPGAPLGTAMYRDQNNDGVINDEDRVILGSFMPDFELGMTNNVRWNNFDLSVTMQSKIGGYRYNLENLWYQGPTVSAFLKPTIEGQWWSPDDPGTGAPATSLANLDYVSDTDWYLEPADYLAIRNLNFGYTLPPSAVNTLGLDRLRVYLSVQNALMITRSDFLGYNPEGYTAGEISGTNSLPGYNTGAEPMNRTVVLGINVDF